MEHTIHLGAKTFVTALNPKWQHKDILYDGDDEEDDEGDDEDWYTDNEEVDEPATYDPGDSLGKLLALITQVCFFF